MGSVGARFSTLRCASFMVFSFPRARGKSSGLFMGFSITHRPSGKILALNLYPLQFAGEIKSFPSTVQNIRASFRLIWFFSENLYLGLAGSSLLYGEILCLLSRAFCPQLFVLFC